jgi:cystathionine beta-synthase
MTSASILSLIGNTPLVEITQLDTGLCRLFVKLENQNPGGSIKDRVALSMIEAAEQSGQLKPGGTIVEATAGNTGLGLALVAGRKGYRTVLIVPDKMSREKVLNLQALGAEVILTRSDVSKGHPDYYQDKARRVAQSIPGAFYIDQFSNPANPAAHEKTTGPEIWRQLEEKVDAVVVGVGSSGTLTGLSRFFARVSPQTEFILADPVGSILADYVETGAFGSAGSWLVEGIGEDFVPPQFDGSSIKRSYRISDKESFETGRALLLAEGLFAGASSGTLLAAALRYCREQTTPKRVVTFIGDSGNKYLSKMYNDHWMIDQGMIENAKTGNLADLIGRPHASGATLIADPDEPLSQAWQRMRSNDVSQLPVLENGEIVGIIDEWDLLLSVHGEPQQFAMPVRAAMTSQVTTLVPDASVRDLLQVFNDEKIAVIADKTCFYGLITQSDLLAFWRKKFVSGAGA